MTLPTTLEERVAALEETVDRYPSQSDSVVAKKDWRSTLGMFADDPIMKEIDKKGAAFTKRIANRPSRDASGYRPCKRTQVPRASSLCESNNSYTHAGNDFFSD